MLKAVNHASKVERAPDLAWTVRHNIVWSRFFGGLGVPSPATRIVQFKLRRKIYDEIITAERWPNYVNVRLLGFCLHVMGLEVHREGTFGRDYRALHRALLAWTKRNFTVLERRAPQIFAECLPSDITYDQKRCRLVRTYPATAFRHV